jgi:hypothetical protein
MMKVAVFAAKGKDGKREKEQEASKASARDMSASTHE